MKTGVSLSKEKIRRTPHPLTEAWMDDNFAGKQKLSKLQPLVAEKHVALRSRLI
ncbi:hypothetical protein [Desulfovibrio sp.]|uniref:hypothetical protein n=1 Tax=Desulfovibrio sp. TaxID=885 RepID=UPI0025C0405C|nr:hypothetical protein [Desulfovibrio sp.]